MQPFLRWAGGKTRLLPSIRAILPEKVDHYYEPFLGGGALFWDLKPEAAYLSDLNHDLITTYSVVRDHVEELIILLEEHRKQHSQEFFYRQRLESPIHAVDIAARFIYLNAACFNGLYRVNKAGQFNGSYGKFTNPLEKHPDRLRLCSKALNGVVISSSSFTEIVDRLLPNTMFYVDPPYWTAGRKGHTAYTTEKFPFESHEKLAHKVREWADGGANVIVSHSEEPEILKLYEGFRMIKIQSKHLINPKAARKVTEVLITNIPVK